MGSSLSPNGPPRALCYECEDLNLVSPSGRYYLFNKYQVYAMVYTGHSSGWLAYVRKSNRQETHLEVAVSYWCGRGQCQCKGWAGRWHEKITIQESWGVGLEGWVLDPPLLSVGPCSEGKSPPSQICPASALSPIFICLKPFPKSPFKTGTMLNVAKHSQVLKQNRLGRSPTSAECFSGWSWASKFIIIKFTDNKIYPYHRLWRGWNVWA